MSTKVLTNNQRLIPFFGDRMSFIRGLDPLGLQTASERAYSYLLPGLNNVTGRIRYYSFYCWLLHSYAIRKRSTDPSDQKKFIRRAEFIIALLSQYLDGENGAIPGSLYASQTIENKTSSIFDLLKATYNEDGSTDKTYWKFHSGAFGQYYLGSLRQIGLISERSLGSGVFVRTPKINEDIVSGEDLALAFDSNISAINRELFFECISKGNITENEIQELLSDFNLTKVPEETLEAKLLLKALLSKDEPLKEEDEPLSMRKATIKHLLSFIKNSERDLSDRNFVVEIYNQKGQIDQLEDESLIGWYYYQFNDYWQLTCTAILNGLLAYMDEKVGTGWMYISNLVSEATNEIIHELHEIENNVGEINTINQIIAQIDEKVDEFSVYEEIMHSKSVSRMTMGFVLIWKLYSANEKYLNFLNGIANKNNWSNDGDAISYFLKFNRNSQIPLQEFIQLFLHNHIIYRHQYVAYKKMHGGTQSTQKFIIEDGMIRVIGNFNPFFSGPRISNLIQFLKDLSIINNSNELSELGNDTLSNLV